MTPQIPANTYGFGLTNQSNQLPQQQFSAGAQAQPAPAPVYQGIQQLLERLVSVNARLSRIATLTRCQPPSASGEKQPAPGDISQSVLCCHAAVNYAEAVVLDIEQSLGV